VEQKQLLPNWWRIDVESAQADDGAWLAAELGASGAQFHDDTSFSSFVEGALLLAEGIATELREQGHTVVSITAVENENWVQRCEEIWKPVDVAGFTIVPLVTNPNDAANALSTKSTAVDESSSNQKILVIPGMGFGTGHHESTRLALNLLASPPVKELAPQVVLDLGTGNGILSFATSLLYGSQITARDIDQNSLNNAAENLTLNPLCSKINFALGSLPIDRMEAGRYDLILANIYAEVLVPLQEAFHAALKTDGLLILSGIFDETIELILAEFSKAFRLVERLDEREWSALLYQPQ